MKVFAFYFLCVTQLGIYEHASYIKFKLVLKDKDKIFCIFAVDSKSH